MDLRKHKISHFEAAPPENVWNKICHALDEADAECQYPRRLKNFSPTPPADAWEKIAEAISSPNEIKQAPVIKLPFTKYVSIAASVLAVVLLSIFILNKLNVEADKKQVAINKTTTSETTAPSNKNNIPPPAAENNSITNIKNAAESNFEAIENAKPVRVRNNHTNTAARRFAAHTGITASENNCGIECENYITVTTKNNQTVRLSSKLNHLADCVSGNSRNASCRQTLETLQSQIADLHLASGDFMGVIAKVELLTECNGL